MAKRERMDAFSDSEEEVFLNFVPPSQRRKATRAPPRKRATPARSAGGVGVGVGVGVGGTPGTASSANFETPSSVKKERAAARVKAAKNAPKITIAIDFGTTFSGVAFTCSSQVDQILQITNLDMSGSDNPKVPSAIRFLDDGSVVWGSEAKGHADSIEWFKLLLVDEADLPEDVRDSEYVLRARDRLRELEKTPEEVIGAYLKCLWSNCLTKMKSRAGEYTVKNSRFHVVMTLPAIWPDYARQRMSDAAELADITDVRNDRDNVADTVLTFVSEPEAAALATLKGVDGRCDIVDDDCFVICDCGGGTVDIVAYKARSTEPMVVQEIVQGKGGLCGAIFLVDEFMNLLRQKFDKISPGAWDALTAEEIQTLLNDDWERIRDQFTGRSGKVTIRLPMSLYRQKIVEVNSLLKIEITRQELEEVFRPMLEKINKLVTDQIRGVVEKEGKKPKYVIFVGGFGRNNYMHEYLTTRVDGVEVLQAEGTEPWAAICKGGVIHGITKDKVPSRFSVEVASRVSRASIGIVCHEDYDENIHLAEDKVFDNKRQVWKARKQMKWLIKQGDNVMTDSKTRYTFNSLHDVVEDPPNPTTVIWTCHISPPPTRRDDTVVEHSTISWTAQVHWDRLPRYYNQNNEEFYELEYQAEMVCSGGATDLGIIHKGRRAAKSNVAIEYHARADI